MAKALPENPFSEKLLTELKHYPVSFRIRKLRATLGLSQAEFADLIDSKQTTISAWENGRTNPSSVWSERIIRAFHLPIDFFLDLEIQSVKHRKEHKK